jgi:hypothetical protein
LDKAFEAILVALEEDAKKKGTKRKGYDHWKKFACQAIGISKMGRGRWENIVATGEKLGYWVKEHHLEIGKVILKPTGKKVPVAKTEPVVEEPVVEDLAEPMVEEPVVEEVTKPKSVDRRPVQSDYYGHKGYMPKVGDILHFHHKHKGVLRGEVLGVTVSVDFMSDKDGLYSVSSTALAEKKSQCQKLGEDWWKSISEYTQEDERLKKRKKALEKQVKDLEETLASLKKELGIG